MHPDKGGDAKKFEELAKAYQALTDEETKKNWIEYGNPDGPGVTQFGIALPKWIIDGKNSYIVLGAYILVFMVIMPIIVVRFLFENFVGPMFKFVLGNLVVQVDSVHWRSGSYHYYSIVQLFNYEKSTDES